MVRLMSRHMRQHVYSHAKVANNMLFNCYSFFYSTSYMCKRTYVFMEYEFDTMEEVRRCAEYYGVSVCFKQPKGLAFGSNTR